MSQYRFDGAAVFLLAILAVFGAAGVSSAAAKTTPAFATSLSSPSVPLGTSATDVAAVTGNATTGAPRGTVRFGVCGPTTTARACTAPKVDSVVTLSPESSTTSTARVTIDAGSAGWYCLLDTYSGDSHYTSATDNSTATECLDVTSTTPTKATPTVTTALSSPSVPYGYSADDVATVTGTTAAGGAPTGTVTFEACGPTATPTACTNPNLGPATVELSQVSATSSTASVVIEPTAPGWYCLLDTYSGDSNYTSATDNSTATECLDVTTSGTSPGQTTPTFSTSLSSPSVPNGSSAIDYATVTGTTALGAPTGTVTFEACGPTATATACTSPTIGPVTVSLSPVSSTSSEASVTIFPGAPGWYCFLDTYSGDANYASATDNSPSTECLDVTG
jgi:hypothetical protein